MQSIIKGVVISCISVLAIGCANRRLDANGFTPEEEKQIAKLEAEANEARKQCPPNVDFIYNVTIEGATGDGAVISGPACVINLRSDHNLGVGIKIETPGK